MSFTFTINPEWNVIKRIKEAIAADPLMQKQGRDFLDAATLAAIELSENALKYSDSDDYPVEVGFTVDNKECVIRVKNRSTNAESKETLVRILDKIKAGDPFQLYVERLEKLKDNPDGWSRMGLYRIAYEAEFKLSPDVSADSVVITARRTLPA